MWWDIIKSSRGEAYAKFIEEFGPGVELQKVSISPVNANLTPSLRTPPKLYGSSFVLRFDNERGGLKIAGQDSKYTPYTEFIIGMFQEEYPERYQEIVYMLKGTTPQDEVVSSRPYDPPTYENIINLIEKKIRDLGLLDDTDYATVHDIPFTAVLEMALEELKDGDWPRPGSSLPRTDTRIKMFDAVLDEFIRIYSMLQRNRLSYRDLAERRLTLNYRKRALRRLLESSFVVAHARIAPREPNSQFLSEVLSIIDVEMNPSGE